MKCITLVITALALSACSSLQISNTTDPVAAVAASNKQLVTDLTSMTYNLDQAVAVGVLPANDPAVGCAHDIMQKITAPAPNSFTPKLDGLASAGSVAYIIAQQAKALRAQGVQVSPECQALIGKVVIDGASVTATAAPLALIPLK